MTRLPGLLLLFLLLWTASCRAADEPILRLDMEQTSAVPGQPVAVRLAVLVPTWMLEPPVFPAFEVSNVLTLLPTRGTGPTSERVGSQTWSGVTRSYRLSPMLPGRFQIPPDTVTITYSDPDTRQPVRLELPTPGFEIVGSLPRGAEEMEPFIAARSLSLERTVEGDLEKLAPGDALILRTIAKVSGVSPIFLPELAPVQRTEGLSAYAQSPVVEETEDRGILSGSRTETVTVMAEVAGSYAIPPVTFYWYNLDSGKVETLQLPALELTVTGTAVSSQLPAQSDPMFRKVFLWLIIASAGLLLFLVLRRVLRSPSVRARREKFKNSEFYAYRQLTRDLGAKDLVRTTRSAIMWQQRVERSHANVDWRAFETALALVGERSYGALRDPSASPSRDKWQALAQAAKTVRRGLGLTAAAGGASKLPPLNPVA